MARRAYKRDYIIICTCVRFTNIPTWHKTLQSKVISAMVKHSDNMAQLAEERDGYVPEDNDDDEHL